MGFHHATTGPMVPTFTNEVQPPTPLVSKFRAKESQLTVLPAIAVHAMSLAKNPNCAIGEFASVVELDMKLATDILKIANSAAYNPVVPIAGLKQAVVRLGLAGCQSLIITSSYASLLKRLSVQQEQICTILWKHSYDTALLSKYLNEMFQLGFDGEEFACGLIHDIGRVLLAIVDPEQFADADRLDFDETPDSLKSEEAIWGTDHCRFGAWYALRQKLPHPIPEVILRHHAPHRSLHQERLISLIAVADHMANHLEKHQSALNYDPLSNPYVNTLAKHSNTEFKAKYVEHATSLMTRTLLEVELVKTIFTDVVPVSESA